MRLIMQGAIVAMALGGLVKPLFGVKCLGLDIGLVDKEVEPIPTLQKQSGLPTLRM